ncbi:MAG: DUF3516 domain-containing protein [Proteobacteria bacterium]|nr:DUF3516 domain-containing protein [Pseudomonadota bacterium]
MPEAAGEEFTLGDRVGRAGRLNAAQILERFLDWLEDSGIEPYAGQEEAFLELASDRHVILSTPTGSGKSLVAVALHFKALCEGRRSWYSAPTKALVNEKFFALCRDFGPESVGMLTGDASINPEAPIVCCTAEVLANVALRRGERAEIPYVVMDEFHFYADPQRGFAWQVPLLSLPRTLFLLMSATLGDMSGIARNLRRRTGRDVAWVQNEERPVPLDYEYRETPLHRSVETLLEEGRAPIYVVSFTQRESADLAQALTSAGVADRPLRDRIRGEIAGFRFDTPYGRDVRRCLGFGVGLHHAGLLPKYRLLVERLAQQGLLRVISGTDTLGVGVNIPIRTVLFTRLAKFDGRRVSLLRVRDFKQIAGRAGRRGFDERGSVVCQAPEHVIEARRRRERGRRRGSPPRPRDEVSWNRPTFERLVERPPETLVSRFRVTHDVAVHVLRRESGGGYRGLVELIELSHESAPRKRRLRREAAAVFRSLRQGGIVSLAGDAGRAGRRVLIDVELQWDFSLMHNLSLYLLDAVACLDREAPDYALDVLSLVESILEDPRVVLSAQVERARRELLARLKSEGVPYEERIRQLEQVEPPRPGAEFIRETFEIFRERHPWVRGDEVRPKCVARELFSQYYRFGDYVRLYRLQRFEGVLLRYLGQVYSTLRRTVPEQAKTEAVADVEAYLRALIEHVDRSLVNEWENLRDPRAASGSSPEPVYDLARDPRGLQARVRAEVHRLVQALAARDYADASLLVRADGAESWEPERFEAVLEPYYADYPELMFDERARHAEHTRLDSQGPRVWKVTQRLLDPEDDGFWCLRATVDLRGGTTPEGPLLALEYLGT